MKQIKQLTCTAGTHINFQADNSKLLVIGENIETPFVDYEQEEESCEDIGEYVDVIQDEARKSLTVTVRPAFDLKVRPAVCLHMPLDWEQQLTVETNNGSIETRQLNGRIKATTRNGKIHMSGNKGNIAAVCANGSVETEHSEGLLDISTSNGKVTVRDALLEGGAIKSGSGRISLQLRPKGDGHMTIFSGNGRIKLALPEDGNYNLRMKTKGKIYNHLENNTMQTEAEYITVVKGTGEFSILLQNYQSGIQLVKFEDFDKQWEENQFNFGFENFGFDKDFNMNEFFDNIFGAFKPSPERAREWKEEMQKTIQQMMEWKAKFGRMGEDISRQFHETFSGSKGKEEEAVRLVLEMLKEGKLSVEDAEKLINALKKQRS